MPEPTDADRICILEKRLEILMHAVRREFSGMGRSFGNADFNRQWEEACDLGEEEP